MDEDKRDPEERPLRAPPAADDTLPGRRAALPEGTFRRTLPEPQGDENRDPPAIAPTGPEPAPRVPPPQPPKKI